MIWLIACLLEPFVVELCDESCLELARDYRDDAYGDGIL